MGFSEDSFGAVRQVEAFFSFRACLSLNLESALGDLGDCCHHRRDSLSLSLSFSRFVKVAADQVFCLSRRFCTFYASQPYRFPCSALSIPDFYILMYSNQSYTAAGLKGAKDVL